MSVPWLSAGPIDDIVRLQEREHALNPGYDPENQARTHDKDTLGELYKHETQRDIVENYRIEELRKAAGNFPAIGANPENPTVREYREYIRKHYGNESGLERLKNVDETKSLVTLLRLDPELGEKLGLKALPYRISALLQEGEVRQIKRTAALTRLKESKDVGRGARIAVAGMRRQEGFKKWTRSHPALALAMVAPLVLAVKVALLVIFMKEATGGFHHKHAAALANAQNGQGQQSPPPGQPQQAYPAYAMPVNTGGSVV